MLRRLWGAGRANIAAVAGAQGVLRAARGAGPPATLPGKPEPGAAIQPPTVVFFRRFSGYSPLVFPFFPPRARAALGLPAGWCRGILRPPSPT